MRTARRIARLAAGRVRRPGRRRLLQHRQPLAAHPPRARGRRARRSSAARGRGRSAPTTGSRRRAAARAVRAADRRRRRGRGPGPGDQLRLRGRGAQPRARAGRADRRARRGVPVRGSTPGASSPRAPGREIVTVEREGEQSWTEAILAALDERVAVVSVPNVHWTDGALIDLDAVADARPRARRAAGDRREPVGRGAAELDVGRLRPDFLVTVGYKWLLGPVRARLPVGRARAPRRRADRAELDPARGRPRTSRALVDYRDSYEPGARRFDMGQRTSFQLVPMAVAALEQLLEWEVPRIAATLAETNAALAAGAAELGLAARRRRSPRPAPARRRPGGRAPAADRRRRSRAPTASPRCAGPRCGSRPTSTTPPRRSSGCSGRSRRSSRADQSSAAQRVQASAAASSAGPSASPARLASQSRAASPATRVPMNASPAPSVETTSTSGRRQLGLAGAADHRALGAERDHRELGAEPGELLRRRRAGRRRRRSRSPRSRLARTR